MKKLVIKLPEFNPLKETPEERKQRVQQAGSGMVSKIVPNKKKVTTKQQRQKNKLEVKNYD